jgi:amidase
VRLGEIDMGAMDAETYRERLRAYSPFTPIENAAGLPAISLPLAWNGEGLPIGVHFVGRYADEATLLRLAAQLEQARPWAGRRPPIS